MTDKSNEPIYARYDPAWGRMMPCHRNDFGAVEYRPASPSPPPSAGVDAVAAWQELCERDDRTSPEEYPDMCLITQAELADFMSRSALTPAPTPVEAGGEAVARVKAIRPMECEATIDYRPGLNGADPFTVGSLLYLAKPASEPADGAVREALVTTETQPHHPPPVGTKVYRFNGCDYGCSNEDTRRLNREYRAYTLNEDGSGPFFTHPVAALSAPASSSPAKPAPAVEAVREAAERVVAEGRILSGGVRRPAKWISVPAATWGALRAALAPAAQAGTAAQEGER